ncbi:MAG: NAD-dependent epimerase/dehydratase family protein [Gemmataceae bacterium]|nr:NAD-dependent epimerase/dehydratase family protein [Gemmataceae bacterium]
MNQILVTGPSGFLGHHVIKLLNGRGLKPRALVRSGGGEVTKAVTEMRKLDVDEVEGGVEDLPSLRAACAGIDTVFHMNFLIRLGGGAEVEKALHEVNVLGTRHVLDAATEAGVARVVVSSSALTVGLSRKPQPIDEAADWATCGFDLPYALSRRQAEQEALARPSGRGLPTIVAVNPSFTMGPEDFVGAPANGLAKGMTKRWFRMTAPIGFGVLDVRDFADGVLRAAERGRHGRRYLLSGENVMPGSLLNEVATVYGKRPPRYLFPIKAWMAYPLVTAHEMWSRLRGKPPKATRSILQLWGRYAWYDTSLARHELGWEPRPLRDTLRDTLDWLLPKNRNG